MTQATTRNTTPLSEPHTTPLSPRMAELNQDFEVALALERNWNELPPGKAEVTWEQAWSAVTHCAYAIMREPVATKADLLLKLDVFDLCCRETAGDNGDGDLEERAGWMNQSPFRLIDDARKLLTQGA